MKVPNGAYRRITPDEYRRRKVLDALNGETPLTVYPDIVPAWGELLSIINVNAIHCQKRQAKRARYLKNRAEVKE